MSGRASIELLSRLRAASFFVALLVVAQPGRGTDCTPADIDLRSQSAVNAFQSVHGPCDRVTGRLFVGGDDVVSLSSLSSLSYVEELQVGFNPLLTSLVGFSSLTGVGHLLIWHNSALPNLAGLSSLESVTGGLVVTTNTALSTVNLPALESAGTIAITINFSLVSITDLGSVRDVAGDVLIEGNLPLESIAGLGSLRTVGGTLSIEGNGALHSLAELSNLETTGALFVGSNPTLTTLGLSKLGATEDVGVEDNSALVNLAGLERLTRLTRLKIANNLVLGGLDELAALREVTEYLELTGNATLVDLEGLESLDKVGDLVLGANESLRDLSALAGLTGIDGSFALYDHPALTSLAGLENIERIGDNAFIADSPLSDLQGLSSLETVGESLTLGGFAHVRTLAGLSSLVSVGRNVVVAGNPELVDLRGLDRLETAQDLQIEDNDSLEHLHGLEGFERLFLLQVRGNDSLRDLVGLESLFDIEGLRIGGDSQFENRVLSSLDGLESLTRVGQHTTIGYNPLLADLDGLAHMIHAGTLSVSFNPRLGDCRGLRKLVDTVGEFPPGPAAPSSSHPDVLFDPTLSFNAPGCNSVAEILAAPPLHPCQRDARTACLLNDRFRVQADVRDFSTEPPAPGAMHPAQVQTYVGEPSETEQSVSFYSFQEGNVELFVKMVDACATAFEAFWVFVAGATNAEAEVVILDTWSGQRHRVHNPRGQLFSTVADTAAFATCDAPLP